MLFFCRILNGFGEARHGLKCLRGRKNQGFQGLGKESILGAISRTFWDVFSVQLWFLSEKGSSKKLIQQMLFFKSQAMNYVQVRRLPDSPPRARISQTRNSYSSNCWSKYSSIGSNSSSDSKQNRKHCLSNCWFNCSSIGSNNCSVSKKRFEQMVRLLKKCTNKDRLLMYIVQALCWNTFCLESFSNCWFMFKVA